VPDVQADGGRRGDTGIVQLQRVFWLMKFAWQLGWLVFCWCDVAEEGLVTLQAGVVAVLTTRRLLPPCCCGCDVGS
jgi:hypothetical protein